MAVLSDVLGERYEILAQHTGGMGVLFVIRDLKSGETLAAKTLRRDIAHEELSVRFQVESRVWMALGEHPNIVRAHRYREIDGIPFLFMEYIDGPDLSTLMARTRALPLIQVAEFGRQLFSALAHAQSTRVRTGAVGLVHRDLKPSNILVRRDRILKVTDWGLVKVLGATRHTTDGQMLGTLAYCAPEQLENAAGVDGRADLFSCGVILHELSTGAPPFQGDHVAALVQAILKSKPEPLEDRFPGVPTAFSRLVESLLSKRPDDRPPTAAAALRWLAEATFDPQPACARCGLVVNQVNPCPFDHESCPAPKAPESVSRVTRALSDPALGIRSEASGPAGSTVIVPADGFVFGSTCERRDGPSFRIDLHPVTNAQFSRFLSETAYRPGDDAGFLRHWRGREFAAELADHPVIWVAYEDAAAYATWARARLPSWEEWEQAARPRGAGRYPWGDEFDHARCNARESAIGGTTPVRAYPSGAAPCGALDMAGNVWEWTSTWRDVSTRRTRVQLGGSWATAMGGIGLARTRDGRPGSRDFQTGFRCVTD